MNIALDQAVTGLASYAELDVLPLLPNGTKKFTAYMAVAAFKRAPNVILKPYEQYLKMFGMLSEDGKIVNVDVLAESLKSTFAQVPTVELFGFTFEAHDVDKLVSRLGGQ